MSSDAVTDDQLYPLDDLVRVAVEAKGWHDKLINLARHRSIDIPVKRCFICDVPDGHTMKDGKPYAWVQDQVAKHGSGPLMVQLHDGMMTARTAFYHILNTTPKAGAAVQKSRVIVDGGGMTRCTASRRVGGEGWTVGCDLNHGHSGPHYISGMGPWTSLEPCRLCRETACGITTAESGCVRDCGCHVAGPRGIKEANQ